MTLEIDHKNLDLDDTNITLSWRLNVGNTSCESGMISITSTTLCATSATQELVVSSDVRNVTLPRIYFNTSSGDPTDIQISLIDEFQRVCSELTLWKPIRFDCEFRISISIGVSTVIMLAPLYTCS